MKKRWMVWGAVFSVFAALAGCSGGALIRDSGTSGRAFLAGGEQAGAESGSGASGQNGSGTGKGAEKRADAPQQPEGLSEPFAEPPALLTSVGQSADYEIIKTMLDKNGIAYEKNSLAASGDLGDAKTLVLAVGGSSKGLGAAGVDANAELKRVEELVGAADEKGLSILAVHIGGEARRGDLSDQFIAPSFEKADYALVVADGDKDGLMAGLAAEKGIPIDVVTSMAEAVPKLGAAFKQE